MKRNYWNLKHIIFVKDLNKYYTLGQGQVKKLKLLRLTGKQRRQEMVSEI